jgi:transcriptional regulator with XRE-family HTH domain
MDDSASLLREARRMAGLTQRQLAERAGTTQSVIARIELGRVSPSPTTLTRLIGAAGFDVRTELAVRPTLDPNMLDDVTRILRLSPEQRLVEVRNLSRFFHAARRA